MANSNKEKENFFVELIQEGKLLLKEDNSILNIKTGRTIGYVDSKGYLKISYMHPESKIIYKMLVSRLIWLISMGEIPEGMVINHIDGVKTNNNLNNLEVVTDLQNYFHAKNLGLIKTATEESFQDSIPWQKNVRKRREISVLKRVEFEKNCKRPNCLGENNSQHGSYWICDHNTAMKWKDSKGPIPEGFIRGRK